MGEYKVMSKPKPTSISLSKNAEDILKNIQKKLDREWGYAPSRSKIIELILIGKLDPEDYGITPDVRKEIEGKNQ